MGERQLLGHGGCGTGPSSLPKPCGPPWISLPEAEFKAMPQGETTTLTQLL